MNRVGQKMLDVAFYVATHPNCTKQAAGEHAWNPFGKDRAQLGPKPNGASLLGPVNRAILAGLITAKKSRGPRGMCYKLRVTKLGEQELTDNGMVSDDEGAP